MRIQSIYKTNNTTYPLDNVFQISTPEIYKCQVLEYRIGLGHLRIVAKSQDDATFPPYHINFTSVAYFSGPMWWMGVNFVVAAPNECLQLAYSFDNWSGLPANELLENLTLFRIDNPSFDIRILAATGSAQQIFPPLQSS